MSMVTSNTTSTISVLIILDFMLAGLSRMQELLLCDHGTRSYGWRIILVKKFTRTGPVISTVLVGNASMIGRGYPPLMMNATSVTRTPIEIKTI